MPNGYYDDEAPNGVYENPAPNAGPAVQPEQAVLPEQPPRPWRTDPEGFKRRVRQQILRRWLWVTVWEALGWALILAAVISVSVCVRLALGQVPAQDMRDAKTGEAFAKAQRDVYGTGRTVKPGLRAYYVPGSPKSFITTKGVEPKTGKVVDKRVVFNSRQQALEWGRVNGERLIFTQLGVQLPQRIHKQGR